MAPRFDVRNKTALVTGGATRIGRAIATALAKEGANVIVHYNTSAALAQETLAALEGHGVRANAFQADLLEPAQCEHLVEECLAWAGSVQIVVNSASSFGKSSLAELEAADVAANMQLHALAPLLITRGLMGKPADGEPGRVVNMIDAYVHTYQRTHVAYNLSKRSLLDLTGMMALEFAPDVTVNAVAPGLIIPPEGEGADRHADLARKAPLADRGRVADVVDAVLYLVKADFVTGQTIYVDGGAHLSAGGRMGEG